MSPVFLILRNLVLTVLIEGVLVFAFVRKAETLYHSVLVNMLTNPIVNLVLILVGSFAVFEGSFVYYAVLAVLEIGAVITEWLLYYKMGDFGIKKALFASVSLNAASYITGLFI